MNFEASSKQIFLEAAYIYYLGKFIDADSSSQHTYYIIANSSINGLSHKERVRLALLASYKNKTLLKIYSDETKWFSDDELSEIQTLGGVIKFTNALNISNTNSVSRVELKQNKDAYDLYVYYKGEPIAESYQANRQKKHIEKVLKTKINIVFTKS